MNTKKLLLATVASFVVMFAMGGLFHMVIAKDFFMSHMGLAGDISRAEPLMQYIALGVFFLALLMSYMYPKGRSGDNHLMDGFKFGMMIGFLWITPHTLILYGATKMIGAGAVALQAGWHIFEQGVGGVIIAMIYGKAEKSA